MKTRVALVPDNLAHYRLPAFHAIADANKDSIELTILTDVKTGVVNLKMFDPDEVEANSYSFAFKRIKSHYFRGICLWQSGLIHLATGNETDVIILWGEAHRVSSWLCAILGRLLGKTIMIWGHGIYGRERPLKRFIRYQFSRLAHINLTYNEWGRQQLIESGLEPDSVMPIWNSLDFPAQNRIYQKLVQAEASESSIRGENEVRLSWIGRLIPSKRLDLLLDAMKILSDDHIVTLDVIGSGPIEEELKALAARLGLSGSVRFHGALYEEEAIAPILFNSTLCVSPGNVGLTAIHAMTYGVPVVSHDDMTHQGPEAEAIVPGVSGNLYKKDDQDDLVKAILLTAEQVRSRKITRESCREIVVRAYNPAVQAEVFAKVIDLAQRRSKGLQ